MTLVRIVLFLCFSAVLGADPRVIESKVTSENRTGKTWTTISGQVEALTDLSIEEVAAVITDWSAYPKLFSRIRAASTRTDGQDVLLTETTLVSALGISVTNRFTLRLRKEQSPTSLTYSWTQEWTDGSIDGLEGSWRLETLGMGKEQTKVTYATRSSVPQTFLGQDGVLAVFFPGELKDIVKIVLVEAKKKKERT